MENPKTQSNSNAYQQSWLVVGLVVLACFLACLATWQYASSSRLDEIEEQQSYNAEDISSLKVRSTIGEDTLKKLSGNSRFLKRQVDDLGNQVSKLEDRDLHHIQQLASMRQTATRTTSRHNKDYAHLHEKLESLRGSQESVDVRLSTFEHYTQNLANANQTLRDQVQSQEAAMRRMDAEMQGILKLTVAPAVATPEPSRVVSVPAEKVRSPSAGSVRRSYAPRCCGSTGAGNDLSVQEIEKLLKKPLTTEEKRRQLYQQMLEASEYARGYRNSIKTHPVPHLTRGAFF